MALVAALLLVPAAAQAAGSDKIFRDCYDDGVLQGHYTTAQLRAALADPPTDIDEYSDCRDVLSRAIAAAASPKKDDGGGTGGGGNVGAGGGGGGGSTPGSGQPSQPSTADLSDTSESAGNLPAPYTPEDHIAVQRAAAEGGAPVDLNGHKVAPGMHLAAEVGRNDLPGLLLVVLALSAAAAVALAGPAVRRRVLAPRQP